MLIRFITLALPLCLIQFSYSQSFKQKLTEHMTNVESVAYSSDGKYLATGSVDGNINLYTIDTMGNAVFKQSLQGHMGGVITLNFSRTNKYLVSGSKDYSARVWNIDTPDRSKVFFIHSGPVTAAFLDAGSKYIITASTDGDIRSTLIMDQKKSKVTNVGAPINDLALSRDNKHYFVAFKGGIKRIDVVGKAEPIVYSGHADEVNALELSPDGLFLASGSSDKTIQIWDLSTGKSVRKLQGFEWKVTSIKYSADGKYVVGGCNNGVAKLFETETGKFLYDYNAMGRNISDVAISRDGRQIAVATRMADTDKFGAILYNSGVVSGDPPMGGGKGKGKPAAPPAKGKGTAPKPTTKKPNGSK